MCDDGTVAGSRFGGGTERDDSNGTAEDGDGTAAGRRRNGSGTTTGQWWDLGYRTAVASGGMAVRRRWVAWQSQVGPQPAGSTIERPISRPPANQQGVLGYDDK